LLSNKMYWNETRKQRGGKTAEVDKIESKVIRPRLADNPPLTPADSIQYKQFSLNRCRDESVF
jgi:hypothetical protein